MALIKIEPTRPPSQGLPVLRLGFRPFFLLAGVAAVILMLLWLHIFFMGGVQPVYGTVNWHAHEMIFGYSVAVIAGFLLTAEKNWTGVQTLIGPWLGILALLWIIARIVPFINIPVWLMAIIDLSFLPILSVVLLIPLVKTAQYKHIIFVLILLVLFIANLLFYLGVMYSDFNSTANGIRLGWLSIILLISVMGGRVIPFFIERGTGLLGKTRTNRYVEILSVASLMIWVISALISSNGLVIGILALVAGIFQALRLGGWYLHALWRFPMLWILFLGYAWIPTGLFLFGYASLTGTGFSSAVHAFTSGAIGLLTIGMMARVSLGHTGRKIESSMLITIAFILVVVSSILRIAGSLNWVESIDKYYSVILITAGVSWATGFLLFVIAFIPVLLKTRIDNRPG